MKPASLAIELEDLCTEVGYRVRRENGSFSGSDCVLEGEKLILLSRKRPPETHVGTLARVLRNDLQNAKLVLEKSIRPDFTIKCM